MVKFEICTLTKDLLLASDDRVSALPASTCVFKMSHLG